MRYDEEPARRILALSETPEMRAQRSYVIELLAPRAGESALGVGADEMRAWAADLRELACRGEYFFSVNRYVFVARRVQAEQP